MPNNINKTGLVLATKKTAKATAKVSHGKGEVRINGTPIELIRPEILRQKAVEAITLVGKQNIAAINIDINVKGGGYISQLYAIRQVIAKAIISTLRDEQQRENVKKLFLSIDRYMLVADTRRCEAKKFGGRGARARRQKSYR